MCILTRLTVLALSLAAIFNPSPAVAGVYGDELSKCLVEKTSDDDKIILIQWIFTVMSVHPSAASLAKVSDTDRIAVAKRTGKVLETLLTGSCKDQTVKAVKYEGVDSLKGSFEALGEIAVNSIQSNARVSEESGAFLKYVDEAKIKAVLVGANGGG